MVNIFNYLDYRDYLRDFYTEKKKDKPFFSYRYISSHVGIDSSYLVKVLQGNRHISSSKIPNFVKLLKLDDNERDFFELLVCFCKAKTEREKQVYHHKLEALLQLRDKTGKLEPKHLMLHSIPDTNQVPALPHHTSLVEISNVMVWNQNGICTPFTTNSTSGSVEQKTARSHNHFITVDVGLGIVQSKPHSGSSLKIKVGKASSRSKTFPSEVIVGTQVDKQPLTFSRSAVYKMA